MTETKRMPFVAHPGAVLQDWMNGNNMTPAALSLKMGYPQEVIQLTLAGDLLPGRTFWNRLAEVTNTPAENWWERHNKYLKWWVSCHE